MMTNLEKIRKVNELLIEVIRDEEHQDGSSLCGLKDVVLSIVSDYWVTVREPEIFMANVEIFLDEATEPELVPQE